MKFRATYRIWKCMIRRHGLNGGIPVGAWRILDVGCGAGNFLHCLEAWFPQAVIAAVDTSRALLTHCSKRTVQTSFSLANGESLPFGDRSFHVVSALQVVEHFRSPDRFLAEAHRVLRPSGLLLLATPNPRGLGARWMGKRWVGIRDDHVSLRSPALWREALDEAGFERLNDGTTLFSGIPWAGRFPLGLPWMALQAVFGWFPWLSGESYMTVASPRSIRQKAT